MFDCENRYGEICPQQEKALEQLGIPLPNPDRPKGKNNNRKQTFDAICRTMLFDICRKHGLDLDREPEYGGREYLEKQDYILMKQKEKTEAQEQRLEDLKAIEAYQKSVTSPKANNSPQVVKLSNMLLDRVKEKLKEAAGKVLAKVQNVLQKPEVMEAGKEKIKEKARKAVREKLARGKIRADEENRTRWERQAFFIWGGADMKKQIGLIRLIGENCQIQSWQSGKRSAGRRIWQGFTLAKKVGKRCRIKYCA